MPIDVDIQSACAGFSSPVETQIIAWAEAALVDFKKNAELTIRIVDAAESAALNEQWRKSQGPTNVLSFPVEDVSNYAPTLLGDIVICAPIVEDEAKLQGKSADAHWAHMIVHGILHLLGYDHIENAAAEEMESLEIKILNRIGYQNPYC